MLDLDKEYSEYKYIAGIDEAGRGALCGPVVAAAVIFDKDFYSDKINDSKKLTPKQREEAFKLIINNAIAIGVGYIDVETIDEVNIYNASRLAMTKAIKNLKVKPDLLLSDAMPLSIDNIRNVSVIKGDAKSLSIAAGSIIAKVCRDHYMTAMSKKFPEYHLDKNKGYATKDHLEAIKKYGPIKGFYRMSYGPNQFVQQKLF